MNRRCGGLTAVLAFFGLSLQGQVDSTPPVANTPAVVVPSAPAATIAIPPGVEPSIEIPHTVPAPIALRVVGSNVKNVSGEYLGRIDNVVINGEDSKAEYAMLLLNYPTNTSRYTPVPWGKLSYVWDQSQVGGFPGALQVFLLNIDKAALEKAPSIDQSQWTALRDPAFVRQIAAFFGPSDTAAVGVPGTASGVITGSGSGVATGGSGVAGVVTPGVAVATPGVFGGGIASGAAVPFLLGGGSTLFFETNFTQGTNVVITTNVVLSNFVANGIETNVVINLTNFPLFASTNGLFLGSATNPAGTLAGGGGTNLFIGSATRPVSTNIGQGIPTPAAPIGAPTGRAVDTSSRGIFIGPQFPANAVPNAGGSRIPPSTVAPPGVIAPQVPPPPASPVLPTAPVPSQPPPIPSSIAPPGTVVPPVPSTPPTR